MQSYRWQWLLVFLALVGILRPAWGQGGPVSLISSTGPTTVRFGGKGVETPAARRMTLSANDVVRTGPRGAAILLFRDGSEIKVQANSALVIAAISSAGAPARVRLEEGGIWARLSHGRDARFDVGRTAVVRPLGTEFAVQLDRDGTATLSVVEGEARFSNERGSVRVRDGQQSVVRIGEPPTPPVAVNLPVLLEWTNELLPVLLVMETAFVSQDPRVLKEAAAEVEQLKPEGVRRLREGDVLHDQGRLVEALTAYDRARAMPPEGDASWEARRAARRGQTLLELGRLDEAEAEFERALAAAPGDPTARAGLAMTLVANGQLDAAREEVQAGEGAGAASVYLALALVEIRRGNLAAAEPALERTLVADPANGQAHAWRSYVLRARNDLAGAEEEARRAVGLTPHSATCRQALADVYLLLGRKADARREARQAVALNPFASAAQVSLANAELFSGHVEAAVRAAHKGVTLDPRSDRAHSTLGAALAEQRRYGRAERHLRRAVELNPNLLDARSLLGRVLALQGERGEAERIAQETLDRSPDLPSAHAALGQVYWLQGRLREAAREYEAALQLSPRNGIYHIEAARVYLDLNDLPAALAHAQQGVFVLPGSSEAHAILGLAYERQENQEQALRAYREAISLSPENSLARLGLAPGFQPRSFNVLGPGRLGLRERAQALLRDPAVLQQVFEPGVTSEIAAGLGGDSREEQRYLHRGQFVRGRVHDLFVASRFSDAGYRRDITTSGRFPPGGRRANTSTSGRLLQSDVAIQARPNTQVLLQYSEAKRSSELPGAVGGTPGVSEQTGYGSSRQSDYNLHLRQYLGGGTHLWIGHGIRSVRISRTDPDAVPPRILPLTEPPQELRSRIDERITELRLDHRVGRHRLTYGLADLHDNVRPRIWKYSTQFQTSGFRGSIVADSIFARDFLHYFQDDYRIGDRGSLIVGAQWLRTKERYVRETRLPGSAPPFRSQRLSKTERELLPYVAFTYNLDAHNLVRILGNETRLRIGDPLLAPSEAFLVGEPVGIAYDGRLETYELDYEHRFSPRTFSKLFLQYSLARDFIIQPTLDQQVLPAADRIPTVGVQVVGLRLEHQINRYLSGFTRWSYLDVDDRTETAYGTRTDPRGPRPNPFRGLQVPLSPRGRGLVGLNYVERQGFKLRLVAHVFSRRFTDLRASPPYFLDPRVDPRFLIPPGLWGGQSSVSQQSHLRRSSTGPRVLFDLRIAQEPSVRTEYGFTVTNLLNTGYLDWPGFPARGRTWLLTVTRRY